jgi:hypothetical protein
LTELTAARAKWAGRNGFNAVFDQASTVWEALGLSVQTVHAAPLPVGSRMSLVYDEVQPVRSQVFTDANIVSGSLQVSHQFDTVGTPAGVRVNFRDPQSFAPLSILQPVDAPDFRTLELFGCTSGAVATQHATLVGAKQRLQRTTITFTTELEGLNLLPGDRFGVATAMVKWAQDGRVESWDGDRTLRLDTALVWTAGATHAALLRDAQGAPTRVLGVTRGAADNVLVLPAAAPFAIVGAHATLEPTHVAFGVAGAEITDWTLTKAQPNGDTVTLEAVNYDPNVYASSPAGDASPYAQAQWEAA